MSSEILTKLYNFNRVESLLKGPQTQLPLWSLNKSQLDILFSPQQIKTFYVGGASRDTPELYSMYRDAVLQHNE